MSTLTPEQINAIRSEAGFSPLDQAQPAVQPKSLSERIGITPEQTVKPLTEKLVKNPVPGPVGTIQRVIKTADKITGGKVFEKTDQYLHDVGDKFKEGADNIKEAVTTDQNPLSVGLQTAGEVAKTAFAPIEEIPLVKKTMEKLGEGASSFIGDHPVVKSMIEKVTGLAQKHPELAKDFEAIVNIATLGAGKVVEKPVQDIAESAIKKTTEVLTPAAKTVSKEVNAVASTEETLTKAERQAAIEEPGRVKVSKLGKTIYLPSETEKRAGELLKGELKSNPVKNVPVIQNKIATLGKDAETYLEKNAKVITPEQQSSMFKETRKKMERYSTKLEMKAYDEQVKMFSKLLPGKGGFNTANFYKALKEYETNVASKLARGKEALLDPTGAANAKLQAAKDIRRTVRDTIGSMHGEFKPKMFDIASLYDALDNVVVKAEKTTGSAVGRFAKKHPTTTKVVGSIVGYEGLKKLGVPLP